MYLIHVRKEVFRLNELVEFTSIMNNASLDASQRKRFCELMEIIEQNNPGFADFIRIREGAIRENGLNSFLYDSQATGAISISIRLGHLEEITCMLAQMGFKTYQVQLSPIDHSRYFSSGKLGKRMIVELDARDLTVSEGWLYALGKDVRCVPIDVTDSWTLLEESLENLRKKDDS